jgi:hypothetical protein
MAPVGFGSQEPLWLGDFELSAHLSLIQPLLPLHGFMNTMLPWRVVSKLGVLYGFFVWCKVVFDWNNCICGS